MNIEVTTGQIKLDRIFYLMDKPDFKVIHVESHSKRFEILGGVSFDGENETEDIWLSSVADTMYHDETSNDTTSIIIPVGKDWVVSYPSFARYDFEIVMYKRHPFGGAKATLWDSETDPVIDQISGRKTYPVPAVESYSELG